MTRAIGVERVTRIELAWPAWKAGALPLSYTRGVYGWMETTGHHVAAESGRQDSNLRSSAPKADALATTLRPGSAPAWPGVRWSSVGHPMRADQCSAAVIRLGASRWFSHGFGVDSSVTVGLPRLPYGQLRTAFIAHHRSQQRAQHS